MYGGREEKRQINALTDKQRDSADGRTYILTDRETRQTDGKMDGRTDGWRSDRQTDRQTYRYKWRKSDIFLSPSSPKLIEPPKVLCLVNRPNVEL